MHKKALITGVNGQDGSYLAEFLLDKGYQVIGTVRRHSTHRLHHINHILENDNFITKYSDLSDANSLNSILTQYQPDEIYNLAAQSHVQVSFEMPQYTACVNTQGVISILEWMRTHKKREIKLYQASTSEMYGKVLEIPQTEKTPFNPQSPYGISKLASYWLIKNYRESYGLFCCTGILFNHESCRRGNNFVTQKIVNGLKNIIANRIDCMQLGNIYAKRDWGHAKDYIKAMWMMLQNNKPTDYVVATNSQYTVKDFVNKCCDILGLNITWSGSGEHEIAINKDNNKTIIKIDPALFRPSEVDSLLGCYDKINKELHWSPTISFDELVQEMCENADGLFYIHS